MTRLWNKKMLLMRLMSRLSRCKETWQLIRSNMPMSRRMMLKWEKSQTNSKNSSNQIKTR